MTMAVVWKPEVEGPADERELERVRKIHQEVHAEREALLADRRICVALRRELITINSEIHELRAEAASRNRHLNNPLTRRIIL